MMIIVVLIKFIYMLRIQSKISIFYQKAWKNGLENLKNPNVFIEYSFPCNFYKCRNGIRPKNFLTFNFNSFATLVSNFKAIPNASPKLLNLNQKHISKNLFFWSNHYKIEVMITSLIEIIDLPNFGQITFSTV